MDGDSCSAERARLARASTHGVPLAFLALFFAFPLATILERGLGSDGDGSALDVLTSELTREVVWFTVWQAARVDGAHDRGRRCRRLRARAFAFRGRGLVRALVTVPFVLPTLVVALAFLAILPPRLERGWAAILIAHAFFNVAVVVRVVGRSGRGSTRASRRRPRRSAPARGAASAR